ncbi:hypothetical protein [Hymenobacter sp. BT730]|uniref:hypothetical protein n=1 Tax=Hymenobacter sp. BT730 TaxID=3063332 RepID=UPI0026DF5448|nr:hypothetical protein [Hymenobacter sp. BT730]
MTQPTKRIRKRKPQESAPVTVLSHAEHLQVLHAREQGKTVMYKQDAWGHIETRFVRTHNVAAWEAKGFVVR